MKKILNVLATVFIASFIGMVHASAVELNLSSTTVNVGKSIDVNIKNVDSSYKLDFESGYFEVNNTTCGNRSDITSDCKITLTAKNGLSLTEDKKISVYLTDNHQNKDGKTVVVTIKANKVTTTTTTTTTTTKSTSVTSSTDQITITTTTAKKSDNTNLKTLEVKGNDDSLIILSPVFKSDVYEYSADVNSAIESVIINATMEDEKSNMIISKNASEELIPGENNRITITVIAESGLQRVYTLNIKRGALSTDATLKDLSIKECIDFKFDKEKFNYDIRVKKDIQQLTINYLTNDESSKVEITGNSNLEDGSKVKLLVTALDGTKKEYVLNIIKNSAITTTKKVSSDVRVEKNPLIIMGLSIVAFGLIGGIIYVIKEKK